LEYSWESGEWRYYITQCFFKKDGERRHELRRVSSRADTRTRVWLYASMDFKNIVFDVFSSGVYPVRDIDGKV